jgi:putative phosphoribosyl transferase
MEDLPFRDRLQAGQLLSRKLARYADRTDVIVLALPRGGVPVGYEVAKALHAPLDVFLVRKLGVPGQEELAMGAIATGGLRVLNEEVVRAMGISPRVIDAVAARESCELARRDQLYRGSRTAPKVTGRTVILVDDGLATGSTMRAAIGALQQEKPGRMVVAAPVAAAPTCQELANEVDEMVCYATPEPFYSVGFWYEDFSQTTDIEIRDLLERAAKELSAATP